MTGEPSNMTEEQDTPSRSKATSTHNVSIASCIDPVAIPQCDCGQPAGIRTSKTATNPNRQFFACTKAMNDDGRCMFFQWCDGKHSKRAKSSKPSVPQTASAKATEEQVEASELQRDGSGLIKAGVCQSVVGGDDVADKDVASKRNPQCFECGQYGHLARECTFRLESLAQEIDEEGDATDLCFKCKKSGHWAKDCPLNAQAGVPRPASAPSGNGGDVCFKCNEPGHWARECPLSQGASDQGKSRRQSTGPGSAQPSQPATELYPCLRCRETGHWAKDCTRAWREKPIDVMAANANPNTGMEEHLETNKRVNKTGTPAEHPDKEATENLEKTVAPSAHAEEDVCFKCKQPGHWASECPKNTVAKAALDVNKRDMYPCLRCGKTGHWAKDCSQAWREKPLDVTGMNTDAVVQGKASKPTKASKASQDAPEDPATRPPAIGVSGGSPQQTKSPIDEESPKETVDVEPMSEKQRPQVALAPGDMFGALADTTTKAEGNAPSAPKQASQPPDTDTGAESSAKRRTRDAMDMPPPKNQRVRQCSNPVPKIDVKKLPLSMRGGGGWDVRKE